MSARILDGKATAERIIASVRKKVEERIEEGLSRPGLAVVLVGDNPASAVYVKNKRQACERAGLLSRTYEMDSEASESDILELVRQLNGDTTIHGILVQLPLPDQVNPQRVTEQIHPGKDVDGFHPVNIGNLALRCPRLAPCTPRGIMRLLFEHDIPTHGEHAVVVGASNIVGRPMALELLLAGATVTCCHRFTTDLATHVAAADLLVVAVGRADIVRGEWIKKGAVVVDVGINRMDDGRLQGDVDFDLASERADWITPVPGGVGPMTVATLMVNTLLAAGTVLWPLDAKARFLA